VNDLSAVGVGRQFLSSAPTYLDSAVFNGTLDGVTVQVLVDSGASENFVDHNIARRLKLRFDGSPASIAMVSSNVCVRTGVVRWPVFHRACRYFTSELAEAGKRPVFENQCLKPVLQK